MTITDVGHGEDRDQTVVPLASTALHEALEEVTGWAVHGYSETSRSYYEGVRDTLRIVLGITTEIPAEAGMDPAAVYILGAQHRARQGR